jgi:hypothetical protein
MIGGIASKNNPITTRAISVIGFSQVIRQISCGLAVLIAASPLSGTTQITPKRA